MGIICACDFIISKENTLFGFPEIRIGMIPAVILPYVNRILTLSIIRELFITGVKFDNEAAKSFGLLYLDNLSELISTIEKGAPQAQKTIKSLLNGDILSKPMDERDRELETLISGIKEGKECLEGINSFMEKRKPEWVK